jgi:Fungal fruit body lectin
MNLKLCMTGSGRSGSILLKNDTVPEFVSVAAGIHNYKPWCDILTDLPDGANSSGITLSYYQSRSGRLWDNLTTYERASSQGTFISLVISESWDGTFIAKVTIHKETFVAGLDHNRVHDSFHSF